MKEKDTYENANKNACKVAKENNYKELNFPCCLNCDHRKRLYIESDLVCSLMDNATWDVGQVAELGICDKYKKYL
jgi:hypothetical protein